MYQSILVPIDGSEPSEAGLAHAIGLARDHHASLHILHAIDALPMMVEVSSVQNVEQLRQDLLRHGEGLLEAARRHAAEQGVQTETRLMELASGRVSDAILDEARKSGCNLIVMGTHGRRGISRTLLGSDAESVLRSSPVPVLLVPRRPK
jgi:nucleotide-binding universal stress UspA family protein